MTVKNPHPYGSKGGELPHLLMAHTSRSSQSSCLFFPQNVGVFFTVLIVLLLHPRLEQDYVQIAHQHVS